MMLRVIFRFGTNQIKRTLKTEHVKYASKTICGTNLFYNSVKYLPERVKPPKNFNGEILIAGIFTWLGFSKTENVEDEIILNIKRSILLIQKEEYNKAEQMLHLCLRLAQQTMNETAITYIYDVMANLALERSQLDKAQKLFVNVMQRLFSKGIAENDLSNIHISLKLAHICHLQGDLEKAEIGFQWSLNHLENESKVSKDVVLLRGLAKDWYGHFLYDAKRYRESYVALSEAHDILINFCEDNPHQIIVLLNDMASANEKMEKYDEAEELLKRALKFSKDTSQTAYLPTIHINLGRLYMKRGLYDKARKSCGYAYRLGKEQKNDDQKKEALNCVKEVLKLQ
ncbi:tetratricopeptide repeat domain 19 isoform X2 [Arctopsyche grandis]